MSVNLYTNKKSETLIEEYLHNIKSKTEIPISKSKEKKNKNKYK